VYQRCPVATKGYTNNSNIMRGALAMPGYHDDVGVNTNESNGF